MHTHLDMPFGGTTSADDFETGTRAAAFGGTTTLIDFAIQYRGQTLRTAFDTWMQKASGRAVSDYAFHCIITDLGAAQLEEMNALVRDGVIRSADLRSEILPQVVRELRSDSRVDRETRIHLTEAEHVQLEAARLVERPFLDDVHALHVAALFRDGRGSEQRDGEKEAHRAS